MNKFNFKNLCPFKWFVLQNFPFIEADFDAITNWQLFCKLGEEINKIIEKTNLTGEQVENLTNAFIELQNYVNNYFENLDVQDEINNKLNEMVQDGTLQEIITSYLKINGVLAFNTISDMKISTNLIDGSICKTLGKNNYLDGEGSFYKIRNITSSDVVDNINIIPLDTSNILIAEKINDKKIYVTPEMFGAKGDGETDDTQAFINFFNDDTSIKILGYNKTYIIRQITITKSNFQLIGNFSTLKLKDNQNVNNMLFFDSWTKNIENINVSNLILDGYKNHQNSTNTPLLRIAGHNNHFIKNIVFNNCIIKNSKGHGIGNYNDNNNSSEFFKNVIFENCKIFNCDGVGIQQAKVETLINNCEIYSTGAENITIDTGCNNCKVLNSNLSLYGHGGSIGLDKATNVIIKNNTIDGLNNTATDKPGFANGISFNSHTGYCENIIISHNIIKNNYNGISIGTPWALSDFESTVKRLNINNNIIMNNTVGIFVRHSDDNTTVIISNNTYYNNSSSNFGTFEIKDSLIIKNYIIDTNIKFNITPLNDFTFPKNVNYFSNHNLTLKSVLRYPSNIDKAGWKTVGNIERNIRYQDATSIPIYNSHQQLIGFRDFQIDSDGNIKMWCETSDVNCNVILNMTISI